MKTTKKMMAVLALVILSIANNEMKAQMCCSTTNPFQIINNRNCPIVVHYEVSDCGINGIICNSTYQPIAATSTFVLPATCCNLSGDVFVWLIEIDGVDISAQDADVSGSCLQSQGTSYTATGVSSCMPIAVTINWTCSSVTIN